MSQFDCYTKAEYVEKMRLFLRKKKQGFLLENNLVPADYTPRKGRLPSYEEAPIAELELEVNLKAEKAEADGLKLGERLRIARDYQNISDAELGKQMGVSRELARLWGESVHKPACIAELAEFLKVPLAWLEYGGKAHLPANSHIGVRVGAESLACKEQLYAKTVELLSEIPEDADVEFAQAYIEWAIHNKDDLKNIARRAGGRWQAVGGTLLFAPWVPIAEHGLSRRYWTDEVEAMIQEELATKPTVYGAWESLKQRCEAMGLTPDEFPRRISLHKRVEKERQRAEQYGVNLNPMVQASVSKYAKAH